MTNKICVYTCITGDYDNLHEIEHPEKNIDYYCFTNNKNLKSKTWQIIQIKDNKLDNVRLARKIKILGHPKINKKYEIAVWSDANVIWQKPISSFIQNFFKNDTIAIFKHHMRSNVYDEAIACLKLRKDNKDIIQKTLNYYQSVGYPDNNGLCESTVFIKNTQKPQVAETMQIWFDMVKRFSRRDQLSFNYAIWKTNLKVDYISANVWDNPWFTTSKHNPSTLEIAGCSVYYGNPDSDFDINKYYIYSYRQKDNAYHFNATIPNDTTEIEFNPTNLIGVAYRDLIITPTPKDTQILGSFTYGGESSFCTSHNIIKVSGDFKKDTKLTFSIKMHLPNSTSLSKLTESLWASHGSLSHQINLLNQSNIQLKHELHTILNSKGWRALEKLRKAKTIFKSPNK